MVVDGCASPASGRHRKVPDISAARTLETNFEKLVASLQDKPNMLITKQDRRTIYEHLFKDGVMVAKKDYDAPKHVELDVKNLHVIKACQSLTSKGYLTTHFSWQWYYYTLTPEGIDYLREYLNLPSEIVPATHKKQVRAPRPAATSGAYRAPRGAQGGDEGYRRRDGGDKDKDAGDFRPRFSGVGRGGPRNDA